MGRVLLDLINENAVTFLQFNHAGGVMARTYPALCFTLFLTVSHIIPSLDKPNL